MQGRLGDLFYWSATFLAGLIAMAVLANAVVDPVHGGPIIPLFSLSLAGALWLTGRFLRYLLARR